MALCLRGFKPRTSHFRAHQGLLEQEELRSFLSKMSQ